MYFIPGISCFCCISVFYLLECISFVEEPEEITSVLTGVSKIMQEAFNSKAVITASLNHPPTNCKELKQIDHTLNGFYLLQDILEHSNKFLQFIAISPKRQTVSF